MGRNSVLLSIKINNAITKYGDKHIVKTKTNELKCKKCGINIKFQDRNIGTRVKAHVKSKGHNKQLKNNQVNQLINEVINEDDPEVESFNDRLLNSFLAADIPLSKLLNPVLRSFLQSEMKMKIPHPTTLRRSIKRIYDEKIRKIREYFSTKDVFLIIDETCDTEDRNVINVMIGSLDGKKPKIALVGVYFANEVNNILIRQVILNVCKKIWKNENIYPRLKLVISDQASYMLLAIRKMKEEGVIFPNIHHITCIVHALNLVCKSIQEDSALVNLFITQTKKFFRNAPKRKEAFKNATKLKKLPPFPIVIRFGSWLKCVKYFLEDGKWEKLKSFFINADLNDLGGSSTHLSSIKTILSGKRIEPELSKVSRFVILVDIIKKLESRDLSKDEQFKLLDQAKEVVQGTSHATKLINSIEKNPDLYSFFDENNSICDRLNRFYCPINSCEVERSFSQYKAILSDRRKCLKPENLKMMLIIKCNQNLSFK